jgi:hypothetical protein
MPAFAGMTAGGAIFAESALAGRIFSESQAARQCERREAMER